MGLIEHVEKQIRGFIITKHNTLLYRTENEKLILLNFLITGSILERNFFKTKGAV
jgi:hypothetical protein